MLLKNVLDIFLCDHPYGSTSLYNFKQPAHVYYPIGDLKKIEYFCGNIFISEAVFKLQR